MSSDINKNKPFNNNSVPIVAFTSGKGGCGKTTLALNFANTVYKASGSVLMIDLDLSNRGSTGVFSKWTAEAPEALTLTRLLRDGRQSENPRSVIEIKDKMFLIPASAGQEAGWHEPADIKYNAFASNLKNRILAIAEELQVSCVVLDCFCGIDILTTSGAFIADHTILVNEPEIVTFTGSLTLLSHLKSVMPEMDSQPQFHFVVNRMRSDQSVEKLTLIYRDNLQQEIGQSVIAHFPFNDRLFKNFGKYPFFTDLLPYSLFSKKMKLLALLLFKGSHEELINKRARNWPDRRIKSLYLKSVDKAAIDADYLLSRLTSFPVILGVWYLLCLFVLMWTTFTPSLIVIFVFSAAAILGWSILTRPLYGFYLMIRLDMSRSAYLLRLSSKMSDSTERAKHISKVFFPVFSVITVSLALMASVLFIYQLADDFYHNHVPSSSDSIEESESMEPEYYGDEFYDYSDDPFASVDYRSAVEYLEFWKRERGLEKSAPTLFNQGAINLAISLGAKQLSMQNDEVYGIDFYSNEYAPLLDYQALFSFQTKALNVDFDRAKFSSCIFPPLFSAVDQTNARFDHCLFYDLSSRELDYLYPKLDVWYFDGEYRNGKDLEYENLYAYAAAPGEVFNYPYYLVEDSVAKQHFIDADTYNILLPRVEKVFYADQKFELYQAFMRQKVLLMSEVKWENVEVNGFPGRPVVIFDNCTLSDVTLRLQDNAIVYFNECMIDNVQIEGLRKNKRYTVYNTKSEGIEKLALSQGKMVESDSLLKAQIKNYLLNSALLERIDGIQKRVAYQYDTLSVRDSIPFDLIAEMQTLYILGAFTADTTLVPLVDSIGMMLDSLTPVTYLTPNSYEYEDPWEEEWGWGDDDWADEWGTEEYSRELTLVERTELQNKIFRIAKGIIYAPKSTELKETVREYRSMIEALIDENLNPQEEIVSTYDWDNWNQIKGSLAPNLESVADEYQRKMLEYLRISVTGKFDLTYFTNEFLNTSRENAKTTDLDRYIIETTRNKNIGQTRSQTREIKEGKQLPTRGIKQD